MRPRNILMGAGVLAVALLSGLWLFLQQIGIAPDALQRKCIEEQRAVLRAAYVQLKEGVTWEEFEAEMLAHCDCFADEVGRQLTREELVAIGRDQSTPAIEAKLVAVAKQCRRETP